ncbi:CRE-TTLL-15 protein [Aphelenchoides avenae]|nr:CRE-TTLL-15 protein [Aphelenchus avenae]
MPDLRDAIQQAPDYCKINHVPGSGFYTSKVTLATSAVRSGIPQAFHMPQQRKELEVYARENPESLWVKKGNAHRDVQIVNVSSLAADMEGSFVQKYVANPLLIDGKKFDLGIYVVITSVHPLRVYYYDTDVLLRFCREDYEPFDPLNENKYVVGDDYLPAWQVASLGKYYVDLGLNFRQTLDAYLRAVGKDPEVVWNQVRQIVDKVFITQSQHMRKITDAYSSKSSFFELSRFDFVIDAELNVYLLEV